MTLVLAGGDCHFPFQDDKAIDLFIQCAVEEEPEAVVLTGDIIDNYTISRYTREDLGIKLEDELDAAVRFLVRLREAVGNAAIYYLEGNHEHRLIKYTLRKAPELMELRGMDIQSQLYLDEYDIEWIPQIEDLYIDDVLYRHGDYVRKHPGMTARAHLENYSESVVIGHCHRMGMLYTRHGKKQLVAVEAGCMCSDKAGFDYVHRPNWCRGFVFLEDGDPQLVRA